MLPSGAYFIENRGSAKSVSLFSQRPGLVALTPPPQPCQVPPTPLALTASATEILRFLGLAPQSRRSQTGCTWVGVGRGVLSPTQDSSFSRTAPSPGEERDPGRKRYWEGQQMGGSPGGRGWKKETGRTRKPGPGRRPRLQLRAPPPPENTKGRKKKTGYCHCCPQLSTATPAWNLASTVSAPWVQRAS